MADHIIMRRQVKRVLLGLLLLLGLASCAENKPQQTPTPPTKTITLQAPGRRSLEAPPERVPTSPRIPSARPPTLPTVWEILSESAEHQTFVALAERAGVVEILSERSPITVFAPPDDYFEKLPPQSWQRLEALQKEELRKIILHHILDAEVDEEEIRFGYIGCDDVYGMDSMAQAILVYGWLGHRLGADEAYITQMDIIASNGRIHFIDALLVPHTAPPAFLPIAEQVVYRGVLIAETKMRDAVANVILPTWPCYSPPKWLRELHRPGSYILLVPNNAAFDILDTLDLSSEENKGLAEWFVQSHIFEQGASSKSEEISWQNFEDIDLQFIDDSTIQVGEKQARIVNTLPALNGTIYVIDAVMVP